jgi:hypothetical protein
MNGKQHSWFVMSNISLVMSMPQQNSSDTSSSKSLYSLQQWVKCESLTIRKHLKIWKTQMIVVRVFYSSCREYWRGKYHCTVDLLFDWFGISCMTTDNFCFYLQNRLIQTSQIGGQWYSNTSHFSIPWLMGDLTIKFHSKDQLISKDHLKYHGNTRLLSWLGI